MTFCCVPVPKVASRARRAPQHLNRERSTLPAVTVFCQTCSLTAPTSKLPVRTASMGRVVRPGEPRGALQCALRQAPPAPGSTAA